MREDETSMKPIMYVENETLYSIKMKMNLDKKDVTIGKLGSYFFRKGFYVYVGSAKRNIQSRIERHLKIDKKLRWHIDYLRPFLEIVEVKTYSGDEGECQLFHRLMKENSGSIPVKGFGSSDCKCSAHLFYFR